MMDRKLAALIVLALFVEIWMLTSDFHFLWKPFRGRRVQVEIAKVQSIKGTARIRTHFQLNWQSAEVGNGLSEGDEIMTGDHSVAQLLFVDGRSVAVGSNSVVLLPKMSNLHNPSLTLTLLKGSVEQVVSGAETDHKGELVIRVGTQKVVSKSDASFRIESSGLGNPTIAVNQGKVQVSDTREVALQLQSPILPPSVPKAPQLTFPDREALFEFAENGNSPILLKWENPNSQTGEEDRLEVATDARFSNLVLAKIVKRGQVNRSPAEEFVPPKIGVYYWRVVRRLGSLQSISMTSGFHVFRHLDPPLLKRPKVLKTFGNSIQKIDAPILRRPIIHYPEPGASLAAKVFAFIDGIWGLWVNSAYAAVNETEVATGVATGAKGVSSSQEVKNYTVDLEWEGVPGAESYLLQISTDPEFKHPVTERPIFSPKYTWNTDTAGFYYWRVASVGQNGERSPFSEFMTFSIQAERNQVGDETTYSTYLIWDEYAKHQNTFRLYYGPEYTDYFFSSSTDLTASVALRTSTYVQAQAEYAYLLNTHYSISVSANINKNYMDAGDYETRPPAQHLTLMHETQLRVSIERRFFQPSYYFTFQLGIDASYLDRPVLSTLGNGSFSVEKYAYFGPHFLAGIHKVFFNKYQASLSLGAYYQNSGSAFRVAQLGQIEVKRAFGETVNLGFWIQEELASYHVNTSVSEGFGHAVTFWPLFFVEVMF